MSKSPTNAKTVETHAVVVQAPVAVAGVTLTEEQRATFDKMTSKSARIRFLSSLGYKNGPIAKFLTGIYYPDGSKSVLFQHVRNVLNQPLKTNASA